MESDCALFPTACTYNSLTGSETCCSLVRGEERSSKYSIGSLQRYLSWSCGLHRTAVHERFEMVFKGFDNTESFDSEEIMAPRLLLRLQVMFTKQKLKKRKAWSDGVLEVMDSGACFLYPAQEAGRVRPGGSPPLDTAFLVQAEVMTLLDGSETELDMEGHLVTVESVDVLGDDAAPQEQAQAVQAQAVQAQAVQAQAVQAQAVKTAPEKEAPTFRSHSRPTAAAAAAAAAAPSTTTIASVGVTAQAIQIPLASRGPSTRTAPAKAAALVTKPACKPFRPPTFRPPRALSGPAGAGGGAGEGGAAAAGSGGAASLEVLSSMQSRASAASIQERYRGTGTAPATAPAAGEGGYTCSSSSILGRYEGVAGSAGNGRYSVAEQELDDMWAEDEVPEGGVSQGRKAEAAPESESEPEPEPEPEPAVGGGGGGGAGVGGCGEDPWGACSPQPAEPPQGQGQGQGQGQVDEDLWGF